MSLERKQNPSSLCPIPQFLAPRGTVFSPNLERFWNQRCLPATSSQAMSDASYIWVWNFQPTATAVSLIVFRDNEPNQQFCGQRVIRMKLTLRSHLGEKAELPIQTGSSSILCLS